jgi:hypothetical protein
MTIITEKEPPFLIPVDRIVRGVQIQDDLLGRLALGWDGSPPSGLKSLLKRRRFPLPGDGRA